MKLETRSVASLIPYVNNARTHDEHQVNLIASSIKEFGFCNPVLIDEHNGIKAGHGRVLAAQKLGITEVPTITLSHLSETQKKAYMLADNRMALDAGWNQELLKLEMTELDGLDFDLSLTGFNEEEIAVFLMDDPGGLTDEDAVPEIPDEPVSKPGDVWILGNHRVMCGDSTSIDAVEKLMDGQKSDIVFTSPPYNVGKTPNGNEKKYIKDADNKSLKEYAALLNDFVTKSLIFSDYVFSNVQSVAGNKVALIEHLYALKDKYADTIIWDKETAEPAMSRKILNSQFEYIHIFSNEAKRVVGCRDFRGTLSNVFRLQSRSGKEFSKIHKATFRVEFPEHFIKSFTESSCYDPFCGTGTTLIACEKLGRHGYGMELDPIYVDVTVNRWQDFTGKKAVLEETGQTFDEVANAAATHSD